MLNPNDDRLNFGQILAPPTGYTLDFAIGTTYSLDLDALVGACIALGLSEETDSNLMKNPICLLEALRATGDKVAVFCEGGQIHMPRKVTSLYALLEEMVYPVKTVKKKNISKYPSFHPKFWLLRYVDKSGDVLYRTVILSRNLTFDRSWDVTFFMDGEIMDEEDDRNEPVCDFLKYLIKNMDATADAGKIRKIRSIVRELPYVDFDTGMKEFYDYEFIPTGIKAGEGGYHSIIDYPLYSGFDNHDFNNTGLHEIMIMSPFVSNDVIKYFVERNKYIEYTEKILITRTTSLSRLKYEDCNSFEIYTMKDSVIDGETLVSEENNDIKKQDIHAKIYMTRKYSDVDLYLGSLNASHNAVYGNVEFMIRLKSKNRFLNIDKLKLSLFGEDEEDIMNPFQKVELSETVMEQAEEEEHRLDYVVKQINRLDAHAYVKENGEFYDLTVIFDEFLSPYDISVSPLLSNKKEKLNNTIVFKSLSINMLSEFFVIEVNDGKSSIKRVIKIPTEGIPEERDKTIITSVINDKACFYRYIAFLLGDNMVLSALESDIEDVEGSNGMSYHKQGEMLPALYEKMLKTAATYPEQLRRIESLMIALEGEDVLPEEFKNLYNTFKKVVRLDG